MELSVNALTLLFGVFVWVVGAGVIWGAIRADIKNIHLAVMDAKSSAQRAHDRVDALIFRDSDMSKKAN
jgi:hypothetical protein